MRAAADSDAESPSADQLRTGCHPRDVRLHPFGRTSDGPIPASGRSCAATPIGPRSRFVRTGWAAVAGDGRVAASRAIIISRRGMRQGSVNFEKRYGRDRRGRHAVALPRSQAPRRAPAVCRQDVVVRTNLFPSLHFPGCRSSVVVWQQCGPWTTDPRESTWRACHGRVWATRVALPNSPSAVGGQAGP